MALTRRAFLAVTFAAPFVPRLLPSPLIGVDKAVGPDVGIITVRVVTVGGQYVVTYLTHDLASKPGQCVSFTLPDGTKIDDGFVRSVEHLF